MRDTVVITCTGFRPEALALCEKWLKQQTENCFAWLRVEDVSDVMTTAVLFDMGADGVTLPLRSYSAYKRKRPPTDEPTLTSNYSRALDIIEQESHFQSVVTMEDDDYYPPAYLNKMVEALQDFEVVGLDNVVYYSMYRKYYRLANHTYSPLAFTAYRSSAIPLMREALADPSPFKTFDMKFWNLVRKKNLSHRLIEYSGELGVGMKGLPGRKGIGRGHYDTTAWKDDTPALAVLDSLINKPDVEEYHKFLKPRPCGSIG